MTAEFIKKSVSLRSDIYKYALEESEKLHGGNFSSFLTYLISCERDNTRFYHSNKTNKEITISKEEYQFLLNCGKTIEFLTDKIDKGVTIIDNKNISIHYNELKIVMSLLLNKSTKRNDEFYLSIRF